METDAQAKATFCVRRIELAVGAARRLASEEHARCLARCVFLYLDSFLRIAPQLRNASKKHPLAADTKAAIAKLRRDYEGFYDRIRDAITGHQLPLDALQAAVLFREIDNATVTILRDDAAEVNRRLLAIQGAAAAPSPHELGDPSVAAALDRLVGPDPAVRIRMDRLGLANANTVGMVPVTPLQESAQTVLSAADLFAIDLEVYERMPPGSELARMTSALLMLDGLNMVDALFGRDHRDWHDDGFADHAVAAGIVGASRLLVARNLHDTAEADAWRTLRNHVAGHVDRHMTLAEIEQEEMQIPVAAIHEQVDSMRALFLDVCSRDLRTQIFLIHDQPAIGFVGVEPTDLVRPYR